jgi:hypothetical protein
VEDCSNYHKTIEARSALCNLNSLLGGQNERRPVASTEEPDCD